MNYKKAKELAAKTDKTVTCYDFIKNKKNRIISIQHFDGSYLEFHSALYEELDKEWIAIFTEHHGYHVYHKSDLQWVKELASPKFLLYTEDIDK